MVDGEDPPSGRASSSRLLLDSKRPMMGKATTLAACRMPMINRIPPTRATSALSC